MEMTSENKAKFFAQYLRQPVYVNKNWNKFEGSIAHLDCTYLQTGSNGLMEGYLFLKPISSISDEDAVEACKVAYNLSFSYGAKWVTETDPVIGYMTVKSHMSHHSFDIDFESGLVEQYQDEFNESGNLMNHYAVCDYLRSKGYALPWMGLSVGEMVEASWIKLQEA